MAIFKWLNDNDELIRSYLIHDLRESLDMHYLNILNFPHHKHLSDGSVEPSYDISVDEVIRYIRERV